MVVVVDLLRAGAALLEELVDSTAVVLTTLAYATTVTARATSAATVPSHARNASWCATSVAKRVISW